MKIDYPYEMVITDKSTAIDAVYNMCYNCNNFFFCTKAMAKKI